MKRGSKKIAQAQPQKSTGPSCGCMLMAIGLCISAVFIIFCVTIVNRPPKPDSELSGAAGHTNLYYNPQRVEETKELIHRIAKELAFPDSQKGLEIVKATDFRAADVRAQLEGKSSYLSGIVVSGNTTNLIRASSGSSRLEPIEMPSFDKELTMISYCLDLCRAAEGESSVAGARAYVRKLSDELGFALLKALGSLPGEGVTRIGQKHPASDFPPDQIRSALRQLEESYSIISRCLDKSRSNAGKAEDGSAVSATTLNSDEDVDRIRYCRSTLRTLFPREFEAADQPAAQLREAVESLEARRANPFLPGERMTPRSGQ